MGMDHPRGRLAFLERPLGRERALRLRRFLGRIRRSLIGPRAMKGLPPDRSRVHRLSIPMAGTEAAWKPYPILTGAAGDLQLTVYAAEQAPNRLIHPPHVHPEEELLIVLHGEVELVLDEPGDPPAPRLQPGQFTYFPTGFQHSHITVSDTRSNYLICKWTARSQPKPHALPHGRFDALGPSAEAGKDFQSDLLFEGPTEYLSKLHCHVSTVAPGDGYEPHADAYDVLMVILEGELEALGRKCRPHDVIFYAARESHGVLNPGRTPARYLVFEFHGE